MQAKRISIEDLSSLQMESDKDYILVYNHDAIDINELSGAISALPQGTGTIAFLAINVPLGVRISDQLALLKVV